MSTEINSFVFRTECDAVEMLAYAGYVLDAEMRGDLLALKVALAPRMIGYAEIATRLASRPDAHAATNPYRVWRPSMPVHHTRRSRRKRGRTRKISLITTPRRARGGTDRNLQGSHPASHSPRAA